MALLGARLVRTAPGCPDRIGRVVEVESYGGSEDRASHARAGLTARTALMFGPPGRAYVYLVYGMYECLNVVCGPDGAAGAVLIRAIEPLAGLSTMRAARDAAARNRGRPAVRSIADHQIAAGPGRLCDAMGIGREANGLDLLESGAAIRLERAARSDRAPDPAWTARIGVAYAGDPWATLPWRLIDRTSRSVSASG